MTSAATNHPKKLAAITKPAIPRACTHRPPTINGLRPTLSDHAPVANCARPHEPAYVAATAPILPTDSPSDARKIGISPQTKASLRLLTRPAWQVAASDWS